MASRNAGKKAGNVLKNVALARAARALEINKANPKAKVPVREHPAPPRQSFSPKLTINEQQQPSRRSYSTKAVFGQPRNFSTNGPQQAYNTMINFVPQQEAYVVQRLGKYLCVLKSGVNFLAPWPIDSIAYEFSLKEQVLSITPLNSITKDNMSITIAGMLYMRIVDPSKTAYGVEDYVDAMNKLAQSTMRTALGRLNLNDILSARSTLHDLIVSEMNKACEPWGIEVLRYNITDLVVPSSVRESMEKLVKADRDAKASITEAEGNATALRVKAEGHKMAVQLDSEAQRIKLTNEAEGHKTAVLLQSEATRMKLLNEAEGQAAAIVAVGDATAYAVQQVAKSMTQPGAVEAAVVQMTKEYTQAFAGLAKNTNSTVFLPTGQSPAETVAQLTSVATRVFAGVKSN